MYIDVSRKGGRWPCPCPSVCHTRHFRRRKIGAAQKKVDMLRMQSLHRMRLGKGIWFMIWENIDIGRCHWRASNRVKHLKIHTNANETASMSFHSADAVCRLSDYKIKEPADRPLVSFRIQNAVRVHFIPWLSLGQKPKTERCECPKNSDHIVPHSSREVNFSGDRSRNLEQFGTIEWMAGTNERIWILFSIYKSTGDWCKVQTPYFHSSFFVAFK